MTTTVRHLELIEHAPDGPPKGPPLLFVHGAYTGAWCWAEHFMPYFAALGHSCHALSLSGHGGSEGRALLDGLSIGDYVADVLRVAEMLPSPPVLIGHSMGGMVVQKVLEHRDAPAAVLLCAVPPHGLAPSALGMLFQHPRLLATLNSILGGSEPSAVGVRDALFHQPVDEAALARFIRQCQPESHRALWDMTMFDLPRIRDMHRPPMLVLGAEHDRLIPPSEVRATARAYGLEADILPDLGHAVMLEQGWRSVADRIADWLALTLPQSEGVSS